MFSLEQKKELLKLARNSVIAAALNSSPPDKPKDPVFEEFCGAFVTLHQGNNLRGCIGYIRAVKPLWETIIGAARAASQEDPRFNPVSAEEVDSLSIEISILTPLEPIDSIQQVVVGKHGLYVEYQGKSGLLLPQVATEHGWDSITFIQQTCRKAFLPTDTWKQHGFQMYVFSAEIFDDQSLE